MITGGSEFRALRDIAAGAVIVKGGAHSPGTRIFISACRAVAVIGHGGLIGIELRAARVARIYADAMGAISRISAARRIADMRSA